MNLGEIEALMSWNTALPIITLVGGYVGSLYTEAFRARRQRKQAILDRIADTERDALLELQTALSSLIANWSKFLEVQDLVETGSMSDEDRIAMHYGAKQSLETKRSHTMALASRITDDRLRHQVNEFISFGDGLTGWDERNPDFSIDNAWGELMFVNDALGERLRGAGR